MVVVDELGFHQATSVAELLADRGCQVEIVTNGMVVGQDLGITLDLETWNVRAARQRDPPGHRPGPPRRAVGGPTWPPGAATAAPPDRRGPRPDVRLGGVRAAPAARGRAVAPAGAAPRFRSIASATAWLPAGPTPRSSRATGWRWPCERPARAGGGGGGGRAGPPAGRRRARRWRRRAAGASSSAPAPGGRRGPHRRGFGLVDVRPRAQPGRRRSRAGWLLPSSRCRWWSCRPRPTAGTWRRGWPPPWAARCWRALVRVGQDRGSIRAELLRVDGRVSCRSSAPDRRWPPCCRASGPPRRPGRPRP